MTPGSKRSTALSCYYLRLLLLGALSNAALALDCGISFWTSDCLGDSDKRYDPDASINLVDQSDNWKKRPGYYLNVEYNYGPDFGLLESVTLFDNPAFTYKYSPTKYFTNFTVDGSRAYTHTLGVFEHTNPLFPGAVLPVDNYGTSTFEKDASMMTFPFISLSPGTGGPTNRTSKGYPIGEDTLFTLQYAESTTGEKSIAFMTNVCLDAACDRGIFSRQLVRTDDGVVLVSGSGTFTRVTEEEWIESVYDAYDSFNVPEDQRISLPTPASCLRDCVTEEDWCNFGDPSCNESPYQEPDAKLTTGAITIIAIGSFLLTALFIYLIIFYDRKLQERRYRTKFATRIAQTIDLQKSMKSLTPAVLADEFNKLDETNDGLISKEELWNFLNANGDVDDTIRERDFNALWSALDTRGTGQVDFLEFCAFFSNCQDEYDEARRKNPSNRASIRQSLAVSMTNKYNEVSKAFEPEPMEPVSE